LEIPFEPVIDTHGSNGNPIRFGVFLASDISKFLCRAYFTLCPVSILNLKRTFGVSPESHLSSPPLFWYKRTLMRDSIQSDVGL